MPKPIQNLLDSNALSLGCQNILKQSAYLEKNCSNFQIQLASLLGVSELALIEWVSGVPNSKTIRLQNLYMCLHTFTYLKLTESQLLPLGNDPYVFLINTRYVWGETDDEFGSSSLITYLNSLDTPLSYLDMREFILTVIQQEQDI